jgi:hypothetical protein
MQTQTRANSKATHFCGLVAVFALRKSRPRSADGNERRVSGVPLAAARLIAARRVPPESIFVCAKKCDALFLNFIRVHPCPSVVKINP